MVVRGGCEGKGSAVKESAASVILFGNLWSSWSVSIAANEYGWVVLRRESNRVADEEERELSDRASVSRQSQHSGKIPALTSGREIQNQTAFIAFIAWHTWSSIRD